MRRGRFLWMAVGLSFWGWALPWGRWMRNLALRHPARRVGFDILGSYRYTVDKDGHPGPDSHIPASVSALSGQTVAVDGFMAPLDASPEGVLNFALCRTRGTCCFGIAPQPNEWVYVEMDEPAEAINDVVLRVTGVLDVGERYEDGGLSSLYRMRGLRVVCA